MGKGCPEALRLLRLLYSWLNARGFLKGVTLSSELEKA